jgi:hypothetical protein
MFTGKITGKRKGFRRAPLLIPLSIVFIVFVFYSLERVEPIKVVGDRIERQGDLVFVEGTLRNTGADAHELDLEVSYFDKGGRKIGDDKIEVKSLPSGADLPFKMPVRQLSGVKDYSLRLDRGHNPYGN